MGSEPLTLAESPPPAMVAETEEPLPVGAFEATLTTRVMGSLVLALMAVVLNLLSIAATYGLVVVVFRFGVGAEIASTLSEALFGRLKKPVMRLGAAYSPVPFSKPLEAAHAPNADRIAAAIQALVAG